MKKINPRDSSPATTAEDLRRRYNLSENATTVDEVRQGESRPVSSGGVYEILGDIEELLGKI